MPTPLQLEHNAPWRQRFRLPELFGMRIAQANHERGLLTSNESGQNRLYAWHIPTGERVCLTDRAEGVWFGVLSPDGRYVYYLDDRQGDEIGHLARVPYEGGQPEDITPDMPPYAVPFESGVFGLSISRQVNMLGFSTATDNGYASVLYGTGFHGRTRHTAQTVRCEQADYRPAPLMRRRTGGAGLNRSWRRDAVQSAGL